MRNLNFRQRVLIETCVKQNYSFAFIGRLIGVASSTISREIKRNTAVGEKYCAHLAHRLAYARKIVAGSQRKSRYVFFYRKKKYVLYADRREIVWYSDSKTQRKEYPDSIPYRWVKRRFKPVKFYQERLGLRPMFHFKDFWHLLDELLAHNQRKIAFNRRTQISINQSITTPSSSTFEIVSTKEIKKAA
ncbi:helix-turn-helix domain-containing protein [Flammeovirga pectinis]|uniref:Helix-turn-helix domain-containing protein n=1 Tax=Flammeovirga pectinis TaxID=2494373 RepID=A0A3Q9FRK5_9BACT|nr:helix-turn-helix domain-containing protein [Flammeovirga pectinis]AZQ63116.1 helix-turn-helix domain-containing protein [Flammeovirga pectinis]